MGRRGHDKSRLPGSRSALKLTVLCGPSSARDSDAVDRILPGIRTDIWEPWWSPVPTLPERVDHPPNVAYSTLPMTASSPRSNSSSRERKMKASACSSTAALTSKFKLLCDLLLDSQHLKEKRNARVERRSNSQQSNKYPCHHLPYLLRPPRQVDTMDDNDVRLGAT